MSMSLLLRRVMKADLISPASVCIGSLSSGLFSPSKQSFVNCTDARRPFFGWLNSIFNQYDPARVKEVGPDRAAAEWLIRCGAGVKWNRSSEFLRDYNSLPQGDNNDLKISEIDGTDSAVMGIGFKHFDGLTQVRKIVFHKATYLTDEALEQLPYLEDCLKDLQISSCGNISSDGLKALGQLTKLENLLLYDLPEIKNREECIQNLTKALPKCHVSFPYAQASEKPKDTK